MNRDFNLVLASGSPRRKQLLTEAGFEFDVIVPDDSVEKSVSNELNPEAFVSEASFQKAAAVAGNLTDRVVLAADTIAVLGNRKIGKPSDREDAKNILTSLMGSTHRVLTGVTVWNCLNQKRVTHIESTTLEMKMIADKELNLHLDSNNWVGKAGAFGFQDGLQWVSVVEGLVSNVVGLPVERLNRLFEKIM